MTRQEIAVWLALPADANIRDEIVTSMADVSVPEDDAGQMAAFRAFLASGISPGRGDSLTAPAS